MKTQRDIFNPMTNAEKRALWDSYLQQWYNMMQAWKLVHGELTREQIDTCAHRWEQVTNPPHNMWACELCEATEKRPITKSNNKIL